MRMGLSVRIGFAALLFAVAGARAADFNSMAFGDVPGKTFEHHPEVGDHQETWARQQAGAKPGADAERPPETRLSIEGPVDPVYERGSTGERRGRSWKDFHDAVEAGNAAHVEWPGMNKDAPRRQRPWPGPNRPAAVQEDKPKAEAEPVEEADELRDSPAALGANAKAYSLWAGLSRPMLLPASSVGRVPPSEASELGRLDYENKILGADSSLNGRTVDGTEGSEAAEIRPAPKGMVPVVLELDLSRSPGEIWPTLRELPADLFKVEPGVQPQFMGETKSRARIRGWISPGASAALLRDDRVLRVEASRKKKAPAMFGESADTELLIGIRIPSETSPNEAVRSALRRLGRRTGFIFGKAIAYQKIPGTDQLAVVVSGRVPVEAINRVLSDPAVVKVAPAPGTQGRPAKERGDPSARARMASMVVARHPALLLVVLLVTGFFLLPSLRGESARSRRPW